MRTLEVVIAEDDPLNRDLITLQLTHLGLRVTACPNGQEVLERCWYGDISYELALLDIRMSGLDGISTARSLRAHPKTCHMPIVFMTAGASPEEQVAAWNAHPDALLIKPFTRAQLLQAIEHALLMRRGSQYPGSPLQNAGYAFET